LDLILDTNAISAVMDGDERVATAVNASPQWIIPVVVAGEYQYGISLLSRNRAEYESGFRLLLERCRILDLDIETARFYSMIRGELREAGTPIPTNDLWIAALCRQHSLSILSRDAHFDRVRYLRRLGW
jgi:tRNA(fMet)-specific endonuclease VapC